MVMSKSTKSGREQCNVKWHCRLWKRITAVCSNENNKFCAIAERGVWWRGVHVICATAAWYKQFKTAIPIVVLIPFVTVVVAIVVVAQYTSANFTICTIFAAGYLL